MSAKPLSRYAVLFAVTLMLLIGSVAVGIADEPAQYESLGVKAPSALFTIYEVVPGQESQFLDTMVKTGPYNIMSAVVANEKILQALPSSGKSVFFSVSRHFDKISTETIQSQRLAAVRPFLVRDPVQVNGALVEHLLADWGWEKGTQTSVLRVADKGWETGVEGGVQSSANNVRSASSKEIFEKYMSSLAFFKSGYSGQVGMLEFFPAGTSLDQVRAEISGRRGFSGASIYFLGKKKGYAAYSEFFKTPASADKQSFVTVTKSKSTTVLGSMAGMVVQNYRPR